MCSDNNGATSDDACSTRKSNGHLMKRGRRTRRREGDLADFVDVMAHIRIHKFPHCGVLQRQGSCSFNLAQQLASGFPVCVASLHAVDRSCLSQFATANPLTVVTSMAACSSSTRMAAHAMKYEDLMTDGVQCGGVGTSLSRLKVRCTSRFEDKKISTGAVIRKIKFQVAHSLDSIHFKSAPSAQDRQILSKYGFSANWILKSFKFIRWIPPIESYSLNVDGASQDNPGVCGGGGCIRDKLGAVVVTFAYHYGYGNSLIAESRAVFYWWREARAMSLQKKLSIGHVYREANQVADGLAKAGCLSNVNQIGHWNLAAITMQLWYIISGTCNLWTDWIKARYLRTTSIWEAKIVREKVRDGFRTLPSAPKK
ncbi:hypothetical protein Taro_052770 [Colocasia esculenta]|uniref:RNase H type-1 domain-containing protein n=1 Tax=Colocasia esculenta TaxID=4460 RepID=A0A843XJ87_COLES|nr:hypothetical protein [Colocasia esculenta]